MEFTGKFDETLKKKAVNDANSILKAFVQGDAKKLFKYTQLSWRLIKKKLFWQTKKTPEGLFLPEMKFYEIVGIHFHTSVMIDVFARIGNLGIYKIRMIAEKRPYKTSPKAKFRYNPNSLRKID